jgi:hypothetical protein
MANEMARRQNNEIKKEYMMKIKVSLKEIKQAEPALLKIIKTSLPVKVSYWISKNIKPIEAELKLIEEKRIELVKKYAIDKDGKPIKQGVPADKMMDFQKDFMSLLDEVVEIEFNPIKMKDIENDVKLSSEEVLFLDKFVVIENNEKTKNN